MLGLELFEGSFGLEGHPKTNISIVNNRIVDFILLYRLLTWYNTVGEIFFGDGTLICYGIERKYARVDGCGHGST